MTNIFLLILTAWNFYKLQRRSANYSGECLNNFIVKKLFKFIVILFIFMGINWAIEFCHLTSSCETEDNNVKNKVDKTKKYPTSL